MEEIKMKIIARKKTVADVFGNLFTLTGEESKKMASLTLEAVSIESDSDCACEAQKEYNRQREVIVQFEEELGEKYNTIFHLW